jgi:hypothetical protein
MQPEKIDSRPKSPAEMRAIMSIFKENDHSFIPLHRPDFRIIRKSDFYSVGVEVTEMYFSESDGNLMNEKGYIEKGTMGKIHKKHEGILWPESLILTEQLDADGNTRELKGVAQFTPSVAAQMKHLADLIEGKNQKYQFQAFQFQSLALIIYDQRNCFGGFKIDEVGPALFYFVNQYKMLENTVFDEIYYLGQISQKDRFIPLRQELTNHRRCLVKHYTGAPIKVSYPKVYDSHIQYTTTT